MYSQHGRPDSRERPNPEGKEYAAVSQAQIL